MNVVFTRPDGSQVLVILWEDGKATLAERPDSSAIWGPPLDGDDLT
jgi:hypothetical protein